VPRAGTGGAVALDSLVGQTAPDAAASRPTDAAASRPTDAAASRPTAAATRIRETTYRRLLGLADGLSVTLALTISTAAIGRDPVTLTALAVPPLFVLLAKSMGLYDRDAYLLHKTTLDEIPKLLALSTTGALLFWLANGALVDGTIDRPQVIGFWAALWLGLIILRSGSRAVAIRVTPVERCLFVGDPDSAEEFGEKLATSNAVRADLVGWIPTAPGETRESQLSLSESIRALVAERDIDRIVLGPGASDDELLDSVRRIKTNGVQVSVLPHVARLVNSSVELDRLNGITLLGVRRFDLTLSSRFVKRGFDMVGSVLAVLVLSPLLLLTAIAIRLDSHGSVLFRQARAGRHGETFKVLKFRSMVEGAEAQRETLQHLNEADGVFKIAEDPRITRIGRVIRKLHIDELPQLFNVLRGEMSLVGPRPLPLDEDRRIEGWHRRRLDIRPGITGPWQVLGSARIPLREMVKLDYQYVADWSLWNDIRILLLTIGHIVRRGGQ